jgi:hypothetical protein
MSHYAIRIKVPVEVVQVVPTFEEEVQDEAEYAQDYYAAHHSTDDCARVVG